MDAAGDRRPGMVTKKKSPPRVGEKTKSRITPKKPAKKKPRTLKKTRPAPLSEITREGVLAAIGLFDAMGRDACLEAHGFRPSRSYFLKYKGKLYDSKCVAGLAWGLSQGKAPLRGSEFSGGTAHTVRRLEALGFTMEKKGGK